MKIVNTTGNVQCSLSVQSFSEDSELETHFQNLNEAPNACEERILQYKYECKICFRKFGQMGTLNRHTKLVHDKVNANAVVDMNKVKRKANKVKPMKEPKEKKIKIDSKMKREERRKKYDCNLCERTFSRTDHVKRHKMQHQHSPVEKTCDENVKSDTTKKKKKFLCHLCPTQFTRALNVQYHLEEVHLKLRPHQCSICNQTFGQVGTLNRHKKLKHGKGVNCNKNQKKENEINEKQKEKVNEKLDGQTRQLGCDSCNLTFPNHLEFQRHFVKVHKTVETIQCYICAMKFEPSFNLNEHIEKCSV